MKVFVFSWDLYFVTSLHDHVTCSMVCEKCVHLLLQKCAELFFIYFMFFQKWVCFQCSTFSNCLIPKNQIFLFKQKTRSVWSQKLGEESPWPQLVNRALKHQDCNDSANAFTLSFVIWMPLILQADQEHGRINYRASTSLKKNVFTSLF